MANTTTNTLTAAEREREFRAELAATRRVWDLLIPKYEPFDPDALRAAILAWEGPAR